jgi:hypothetical protein
MRGNPKHFAGAINRLKPLHEPTVRAILAAPPPDVEVHDFVADRLLWAGAGIAVDFLLARSDDGVLRTVEAGLTSTGDDGYADAFEAMCLRLLELAVAVGGRLYREPFDRSGRFGRAEIEETAAKSRAQVPPRPRRPAPRLLVDFGELTDEEADTCLRAHAARAPGRLVSFRADVSARGGPSAESLDASFESVLTLAKWLFESFPRAYDPVVASFGEDRRRSGFLMLTPREWRPLVAGEPDGLPPWCHAEAEDALSPLPPAALWLVDGLGYYLAECASREFPEAEWTVYHAASKRLHDVFENTSVLATAAGRWNPHHISYSLLLRAFNERPHEPEELVLAYRYGLESLGGPRVA